VDDEPNVLEALALNLRRRFEVVTATEGAKALVLLKELESAGGTAVVVSDMRMPGMDGATFLTQVRQMLPNTVRILLTGQTDLASAIKAVNDGQLFRFLTKPCPPATLLSTIEAGVQQHQLQCAERVLLEQTLHGSIRALTEVLALTNPLSFGRASRIKARVTELAQELKLAERWQVEVAAMLSQLGCITLPAETVEKMYYGKPLLDEERAMIERLPTVTEKLLGNIPRLETVRAILAAFPTPNTRPAASAAGAAGAGDDLVRRCAQVLKVVSDLDVYEAQGQTLARAFDLMRGRADPYDAQVLEAYAAVRGRTGPGENIRELPFGKIVVGMVFAEDVCMRSGTLLAPRGFEVTESFLERARNFQSSLGKTTVLVVVSDKTGQTARAA
jgi:response regulator RpfG family c-di-GMP phosphodiesterase